jgi:hypothetical protein
MSMVTVLKEILAEKRSAIIGKWSHRFFSYYPVESQKFLGSQKDRFANPIGYTINSCVGPIFDELIGENDPQVMGNLLRDVIKIRAVQEFSPSQAIRFVFDLKGIIRGEVGEVAGTVDYNEELSEIESRIDELALIAFDSYMESRERLFKIRIDEVKARAFQSILETRDTGNGGNGEEKDL